jgi:hypothetical protein
VLNAVSLMVPNIGPLVEECSIIGGVDGFCCRAPYDYTDRVVGFQRRPVFARTGILLEGGFQIPEYRVMFWKLCVLF